MIYDYAVIGAGPIGSYAASKLASLGHTVSVLESKAAAGLDVCCTGIISHECFEEYCGDEGLVLRKVNSAVFFGPYGSRARLENRLAQACIVDRAAFNESLASRAVEAGAQFHYCSRVVGIKRTAEGWRLGTIAGDRFEARSVVVASGLIPAISKSFGLGRIESFLFSAQTECGTWLDEVEIYFDQVHYPGGFAWLVPTVGGRALAGVMSVRNGRSLLLRLLAKLQEAGKVTGGEGGIRQKAIPIGCLARAYGDDFAVVGEAAGQAKPTTGGGLYFGLKCADLAVDALHRRQCLGERGREGLGAYEKAWRDSIGRELRVGYMARRLYRAMSNRQIDRIIAATVSSGLSRELAAAEDFAFDRHSSLLRMVLRRPRILASIVSATVAPAIDLSWLGVPS